MKKYLLLVCLTAVLGSIQLRAQDAKATLDAAERRARRRQPPIHVEFPAAGSTTSSASRTTPTRPGPASPCPAMTMTIDFATPAMRDDRRRQQFENPPLGGGFQPLPRRAAADLGHERQLRVGHGRRRRRSRGARARLPLRR